MLEKLDLEKKLSHKDYKLVLPALQQRLYDLEKACWDNGIASIIIFEGWDAAGKGSAVASLTARLDPRGFKLHPIQPPRTFELERPWLWRFWLRTPERGEMAIFDRSWYLRVLDERVAGQVSEREWREAYRDILDFERALADDGTVIMKFWLHISKKEQKKRFKDIESDPLEAWHVTEQDWERHRQYERYFTAAEEMLEWTDSEYGPWTIVEATSRWYARRKIFETVIAALEARLGRQAPPPPSTEVIRKASQLQDAIEAAADA